MLASVSWSAFFTAVSIILAVYYAVVVGIYFRKEFFQLFSQGSSGSQGFHLSNEINDRPLSVDEMTAATGKGDPFLDRKVHELLEDVKQLLMTAAKVKTVREELLMALQMLLRNYSILKDLPITTEINGHIISEVKAICSIALSDAETNMLWNG